VILPWPCLPCVYPAQFTTRHRRSSGIPENIAITSHTRSYVDKKLQSFYKPQLMASYKKDQDCLRPHNLPPLSLYVVRSNYRSIIVGCRLASSSSSSFKSYPNFWLPMLPIVLPFPSPRPSTSSSLPFLHSSPTLSPFQVFTPSFPHAGRTQHGHTLTTMDSMPCPRFYKPSDEYNYFSSSHSDDATWDPEDQYQEAEQQSTSSQAIEYCAQRQTYVTSHKTAANLMRTVLFRSPAAFIHYMNE